MENNRIKEILNLIIKNEHNGIVNREKLEKKVKTSEINFLNNCKYIQLDPQHVNITNEGVSFLNNENMRIYTKWLLFITIGLVLFTIIMIIIPLKIEEEHKTNEVNTLIAEIEGLELEMEKISSVMDILKESDLEEIITPFQFPLENLRANTYNENIRNSEIKGEIIILYSVILQTNEELKFISSIEFIQDNSTLTTFKKNFSKGVIDYMEKGTIPIMDSLKIKLKSYKECIAQKKDFDKC